MNTPFCYTDDDDDDVNVSRFCVDGQKHIILNVFHNPDKNVLHSKYSDDISRGNGNAQINLKRFNIIYAYTGCIFATVNCSITIYKYFLNVTFISLS